jgi:hypothetical protein
METMTDIENKAAPSVDVPRLVRLYDWLRVEQHHGKTIACGGIFPAEEIKEGQRWQGSSGHAVTVESVNAHSVYYSWIERGTKMTQDKAHFAFQCRYCLILPNVQSVPPERSAPDA